MYGFDKLTICNRSICCITNHSVNTTERTNGCFLCFGFHPIYNTIFRESLFAVNANTIFAQRNGLTIVEAVHMGSNNIVFSIHCLDTIAPKLHTLLKLLAEKLVTY